MNSTTVSTHNKVSQVFAAAGQAFNRLGELTMQLHIQQEALPGSKWTDEEVEMLQKAVNQFGNNLEKVSECIKTRTMSQVKHAIKRKVYTEAGMPLSSQKPNPINRQKRPLPVTPRTTGVPDDKGIIADRTSGGESKKAKLNTEEYNQNISVTEASKPVIMEQVTVDSKVDVENPDESTSLTKLDWFISAQPPDAGTPGGVSESTVSNPPPLPPLDLVTEQT